MGHFLGSILKAILHSLLSLEQVAGLFAGLGLKGAVHGAAGHGLVEIHEVAVEVGAVHAGKLGLAAHGQAAAAAHAGAVDHDGVHGDDALEAVLLAGLDHELHHDEGADGDDEVVLVASGHQLVEGGGDNALGAVAAVVGHDAQLIAAGFELILENEQILAAEAHDAVDDTALLVQLPGDGQSDGAAHAAADDADLLQALGLGGAAQRADEIVDALAHLKAVQLHRGTTDDLEDDVHGALLPVVACDGEGDTLAVLERAHNDKLARLCLFGNEGGFNDHLCNGGVERHLFRDLVHCVCSFS